MKTRLLLVVGFLALVAGLAKSDWVYHQQLVNAPALATSQTYVLNLNTTPTPAGISSLSAQAVYSTATVAAQNFTDGTKSAGSFTVGSVSNLVAVKATNQVTVTPTATLLGNAATNYITVISTTGLTNAKVTFNNNVLLNGRDWFVTTTTTGTAASILTAMSRYNNISLSRADNVISATATVVGTQANAFTLTSSASGSVSIASPTFHGGRNPVLTNAYLTVNGTIIKNNQDWFVQDTSSGTATSIATAMALLPGITASASGSVVYATATAAGVNANAYTVVSSSPGYLTVAGATFTGGVSNAYVSINGTRLTQGTEWTKQSTASGTAKSISDAITASSSLNTIVVSTWNVSGVVSTTSSVVGTGTNYTLASSIPGSISVSGATMTGGTSRSYAVGSPNITIASNGFSTGLPVVYSSNTTGVTVSPLVAGTQYFVSALDTNTIALATSKANAAAGTYITLLSSTTAGGHTFTLTPTAYSGIPSFKWVASNDGTNFDDIAISSVTYSTPVAGSTTTTWDFGPVNYKYIGMSVIAPTTGGLNLVVTVNGTN